MYNFTTIPGEGYGDNGQGTELELLLNARLSSQVEVKRPHPQPLQPELLDELRRLRRRTRPALRRLGDCGEFDPRSNQYIKLRGVAVVLTPGYLIDSATIGANDFGQFDPFVIGRIRYIDRDNAHGILLQGSRASTASITWDAARISLPRLWAGPNFSTGAVPRGGRGVRLPDEVTLSDTFDVGGIFSTCTTRRWRHQGTPTWTTGAT